MDEVLISLFHAVYRDLILLHDAYVSFQSMPARRARRIEDFVQGVSFLVEVESMYHLTLDYEDNGENRTESFNPLEFVWEILPGSRFLEFISDEFSQVG